LLFSRLAVLLAGVATGALAKRWLVGEATTPELQRSLKRLAREMRSQAAAYEARLQLLETRVEDHQDRLERAPSTVQMVSAMEELLGKAMAGMNERLTAQAESMETLQMTVTQTDELLERVLESLDLLQSESAGKDRG
jgi:DNA repair ATPase RecN